MQQPYYEWDAAAKSWDFKKCLPPQNPGVPLPRPDWVAHGGGRIRAQICGNPDFGLAADETLNIIAAGSPRGRGELAIFWLWFLENGRGMLFTEGNYLNPLSHNLQLIDYSLFVQNADLTQADFENPCPAQAITAEAGARGALCVCGSDGARLEPRFVRAAVLKRDAAVSISILCALAPVLLARADGVIKKASSDVRCQHTGRAAPFAFAQRTIPSHTGGGGA